MYVPSDVGQTEALLKEKFNDADYVELIVSVPLSTPLGIALNPIYHNFYSDMSVLAREVMSYSGHGYAMSFRGHPRYKFEASSTRQLMFGELPEAGKKPFGKKPLK